MKNRSLAQRTQEELELYDPYNLFEIKKKSIRLKERLEVEFREKYTRLKGRMGELENICKEHDFIDVLKIEDNYKLIKFKLFKDKVERLNLPTSGKLIRFYRGEPIGEIEGDDLKKIDWNEEVEHETSCGTNTINELIKNYGGVIQPSDENDRIIIDVPLYRMEADFILLQGYRKLHFDFRVKEDKKKIMSNLFDQLLCNEFNPYLHRQNINTEVKTFILSDMKRILDPIPTIWIDDWGKRSLTPAFIKPSYGFKFITPYYYKNGFFIFHDGLKLISKIGSAFSEFAYDINMKKAINTKDKKVEFDIKDIHLGSPRIAKDATHNYLNELFYNLIKDQVKVI